MGKFLPDVDRPNEGVFAWQDEDEQWLALRYDLTAPLARVYAQHRMALPTPYRRYQVGPVWRNEKPGPGRFRQFYQCDADTVGSASVAADAEMCVMLGEALEAAGIARGDYVIRVNNRKVLNGVMEVAGLLDPADPEAHGARRGIVMRAIDKIDRLGEAGVRALLGAGTAGRERGLHRRGRPRRGGGRGDPRLHGGEGRGRRGDLRAAARARRQVAGRGSRECRSSRRWPSSSRRGAPSAVIDPAVVRGLGYYTGPVVEAELTFQVVDEDGRPRQFGSVAGGGRYDDLVRRFTGEAVPATGISIGVDRLLAALGEKGRLTSEEAGPVVVTVMDRAEMAGYQGMAAELRAAGLRAEVFLGGGNMARQLKYADQRRGCGRGDRGRRRAGAGRGPAQGPGARGAAGGGDRDARGLEGAAGAGGGAAGRAGRGGSGDAGAGGLMVADRAFLAGARMGPGLARLDGELARILGVLRSTGAMTVEPAALQPADVLLDLYGEDIRARAFVTRDEGAEMMLRPDFTVPIVRLHMDAGAEPARYVYSGPVWRRQDAGSTRPREYLQAGFEVFEGGDAAAHDAEVLGLDHRGAGGRAGRPRDRRPRAGAGGDRRARHQRGAQGGAPAARLAAGAVPCAAAAVRRGACRGAGAARRAARRGGRGADARAGRGRRGGGLARGGRGGGAGGAPGRGGGDAAPGRRRGGPDRGGAGGEGPRPGGGRASSGRWRGGCPGWRRRSTGWRRGSRPSRRAGSRPEALRFEASFGRTSLEYYDGMVFGAMPRGRDDLPPVASGGRYDTLTRVLGAGRGIPAVGGMIRPEALVALTGAGRCG